MKTLLRLLLVTIATLGLVECGVRVAMPSRSYEAWRESSIQYRYHPSYAWSIEPGTYRSTGGPILVNSLGLRGAEIERPKPDGRLRIVVLGGSSTFNYDAAEGRTWSVRLEAALGRALGGDVEVINAGTPGYSTYQSSLRLDEQLIGLEPDAVLVYHLWNDLKSFWMDDPRAMAARWDELGRRNEASTLLRPSPWLDAVSRRSQTVTYARFAALRLSTPPPAEGWSHPELDKRVSEAGVAFYVENLVRIADRCAASGIPLGIIDQALLVTPDGSAVERERIRYDYTGFDHPTLVEAIERARDEVRRLAERPGVRHVTTDTFPADPALFRDHVHLTDAGLERLAAVIAPQVEAMLVAARDG